MTTANSGPLITQETSEHALQGATGSEGAIIDFTRAASGTVLIYAATRVQKGTPIGGTDWILNFDLGVELEFGEDSVVAYSLLVDDYAQGSNRHEAVLALLASLSEYLESLEQRARVADLSDELKDALGNLQTLLVKP
ncbi:MAG: hypothetical protein IIA92_07265 [Chloroflexi bacterium]|nr:hypothetical protein [Chloroflexota bacterium]